MPGHLRKTVGLDVKQELVCTGTMMKLRRVPGTSRGSVHGVWLKISPDLRQLFVTRVVLEPLFGDLLLRQQET